MAAAVAGEHCKSWIMPSLAFNYWLLESCMHFNNPISILISKLKNIQISCIFFQIDCVMLVTLNNLTWQWHDFVILPFYETTEW